MAKYRFVNYKNILRKTILGVKWCIKNVDFGNELLIEKPMPPLLFASDIVFIDENNNNRIDANESCKITFKISNKGKGSARSLIANLNNKSIELY